MNFDYEGDSIFNEFKDKEVMRDFVKVLQLFGKLFSSGGGPSYNALM